MQRLWIGISLAMACSPPSAEPDIGGTAAEEADEGEDDAVLEDGGVVEPPTACTDATPSHVDPLRRRAVADFEPGSLRSIAIAQSASERVYGCSTSAGLVSWDVTDPTAPALDGTAAGEGCERVWVDDAGATVVTTNPDGVQLWSAGPEPALLATWAADVEVKDAIGIEDRVVVAAGTEGIVVLERDGNALRRGATFRDGSSNALGLALGPQGLVVAEGESGVRTYDVERWEPGESVAVEGVAVDVAVVDDRTVVAALDGVAVLGGSTGDVWFPSPGTTVAVAAGEATILAADWLDLRQLAVDDEGVRVVGGEPLFSRRTATRFSDVAIAGTQAFATDGSALISLVAEDVLAPDIVVEVPRIDFGGVGDDEKTRAVLVLNAGSADLHLCAVDTDIDGVDSDVQTAVIAPGESLPIELSLAPVGGAAVRGEAIFSSNDPDQGELAVPVVANPDRVDVGEPAAAFNMIDLDGRPLSNEDLLGSVVLLTYFTTW